MSGCKHLSFCFGPSPHAQEVGFQEHAPREISKTLPEVVHPSTFPAPLVLPGDELSFDPKYQPQSIRSWLRLRGRIAAQSGRRTIYVVRPPKYAAESNHVREWAVPQVKNDKKASAKSSSMANGPSPPEAEHVREYLQAFYDPLPVRLYEGPGLEFVPWTQPRGTKKNASEPARIGLSIGAEAIGIRHRPSKDKLYTGQLNLEDLLDAAIAMLPKDAYALLMLVDHDLYENEDDDFCCGRAYGGNRVAVVSSSRYNPTLDKVQEIETEHVWPLSHCQTFVSACCSGEAIERPRPYKNSRMHSRPNTAMEQAVLAYQDHGPSNNKGPVGMSGVWLARMCKTASHEVGHVVGMDHCVYYACVMQGTAGLSEDGAQPPYLCPVDLEKTLKATGGDAMERYEKLLSFCEKWSSKSGGEMWAAWAGWLKVRLRELPSHGGSNIDDPIQLSP